MNGKVERVVVALDAISEHRTAIDTAARLAQRWKTRLHGVFVEDDDLIRLAHLPFARQVTLGVGVEALDLRQAERQMRVYAARARRELAASAARHGVEWSFETVRDGETGGAVASMAGDFLVAGTTTRPVGGHFRVEGRWWAVREPGPAVLLLAQREHGPRGVIAVLLHDRDPASERLLAVAARLAEAHEGRLVVLCAAELAATAGFKDWFDNCLVQYQVTAELDLASLEPAPLVRRIVEMECRLVALGAQAQPERLRELVAQLACDVLVVR
ncbi:MAG TPA: hypothetical protein VFC56_05585 [Stellaceae bacterium]|nr:hypothetical protein [Stellaceae bacterium]